MLKTAAIVLAAGAARRFGRPKQLLELDGESLVRRACRIASESGCSPVILVLGAHAETIIAEGIPEGVCRVMNDDWERGMGNSLAKGAALLGEAEAVIVLLADQPGVTADTLSGMQASLAAGGASLLLCDHGEAMGPPALFLARHFPELARLDGEEGGRSITRRYPDSLATHHAPEARWDIDGQEAWETFNQVRPPE